MVRLFPAMSPATATLLVALAACGGSSDKGTGPSGIPGTITATSNVTTAGRAGLFPVDTPVVVVRTVGGTPVAGVPVVFTVLTGAGTVSSNGGVATAAVTVTSNANGLAGVKWRLGGTLGAQTVQAKVDTFPAVVFSATASAGITAQLLMIQGNAQTGAANAVVPTNPRVQAKDAFGNAVPGDTIDFTSTLGTNVLTATRQITDAGGFATVGGWTLPACGGPATVTATSRSLGNPNAAFGATVTGGGAYCIELIFTTTPDAALRAAAENAAARWSRVITSSLPTEVVTQSNFTCAAITGLSLNNRSIKSIVIYVQLAPIVSGTPGLVTLGSAGPCFVRSTSGLTVVGGMRLNSDYLLTNLNALQRDDVVLHEMGHVLGFGTLWTGIPTIPSLPVLLPNPAASSGAGNPQFVGALSLIEFLAMGGPAGSTTVPVENCGAAGTINGHWKEGVTAGPAGSGFGTELMTGYLSAPGGQRNPFSRLSIAAMGDLGYTVDLSQADAYTLNSQQCPAPLLIAPEGSIVIGSDVVREELVSPTHMVRRGRVEPLIRK